MPDPNTPDSVWRPDEAPEMSRDTTADPIAIAQALIEASPDCLKRLDLDGNLLWLGEAGRVQLGLEASEPRLGTCWYGWWEGVERVKVERAVADARAGHTSKFEAWATDRRGDVRCWSVTVTPIRDARGAPTELLAASRDVTLERAQQAIAAVHQQPDESQTPTAEGTRMADGRHYAIFSLDVDGRVLNWNAAAELIFGWRAEAIVGANGDPLWTPEDREAGVPARERANAVRDGMARDQRWHMRHDGTRVFIDGVLLARTDSDGRVGGFVKIGRNDTAHRRIEEELNKVRRRLDSALIAGELGTYEWEIDTDRIHGDANFQRIFGISTDASGGLPLAPFIDAIHPDDRELTLRRISETIEMQKRYETEYRILRGDGERWVIARGRIDPATEEHGRRFAGVILDVTERKRAEEQRRFAEAERGRLVDDRSQMGRIYDTILSTTDDFAYIFDLDGRVLYANRRLLEVWGVTLEEATGRTLIELGYPVWHAAMHRNEIDQVIRTRRSIQGEVPFTGGSGISGIYEYVFSPVIGPDGNVERVVGTTRDITARRRAEDDLRRSASRTKLFAELAEATRDLADPTAVIAAVAQRLGEFLGVSRSAYADVAADGDTFEILPDYCNVGVASCAGTYSLQQFGPRAAADMQAGRTLVIRDIDAEFTDSNDTGRVTFDAIDCRAIICCPLVRAGSLVAMMAVHQATPRDWTQDDVQLVEAVVERAWAYIERARSLRALAASEARFRQLADSMPLIVWSARPDGTVDYYNRRWYEYTGLQEDGTIGDQSWQSVFTPEEAARVAETWYAAAREGSRHEQEYLMRRAGDGAYRWHLARALPFRDAAGQVVRWYGTLVDIHDQKVVEQRIAESEARLRQLADAMPQIVFAAKPDGTVDYFNRRWYEYTGLTESADLGFEHWRHVHDPAELERVANVWMESVRGGIPYETEYPLRRQDGQWRWHLARALPVRNAEGEIIRWFGTNTDIHDQKVAENALAAEKTVLGHIAEGASLTETLDVLARGVESQSADGMLCSILVTDGDGRRLRHGAAPSLPAEYSRLVDGLEIGAGSGSCGTAAYTRGLIVVDDISTDPKWTAFRQVAARFGLAACSSLPILRSDGTVSGTIAVYYRQAKRATDRDLELLRTAGHLAGIAIERDRAETMIRAALASERVARAESEHAGRMKDEFLATLSHELRTPLSAILGWSQMLRRDGVKPESLRQGLETIERNARAQTQIIEDLLDMSRIISGKVVLDTRRLDLGLVIRAAIETVRPAAMAKGVDLLVNLAEQATPVIGDANRLQQVFWNLLTNAVKFTPRGGVVRVDLGRIDSQWSVTVADSGEGIRADFLPHVFDRFRQADASTTRRHGGLGLGLAIVKQIVELHGGQVGVRSQGEGSGATFDVKLPITVFHHPGSADDRADFRVQAEINTNTAPSTTPDAGVTAEPVRPPEALNLSGDDASRLSGTRILIVDDEADARTMLRYLLEAYGATVAEGANAQQGVEIAASFQPDAIVSDVGMPGENGYSMLARIRDGGIRVPAIALTAYARVDDRVRAIRAGFQMHVPKPVEPAELIETVVSVLRR